MKNTIIWVVVILIVIIGVFWYMNRPAPDAGMTVSQEQEEEEEQGEEQGEAPQSVAAAFSAQNDSGMSGTATLVGMNGNTLVTLALTGAPEGMAQPAHIHAGSCADIGGVIYPLESPVNGVSETTLNVSIDVILGQLPLALNVHKSPEESDIYVACADLTQ